MLAYLSSYEFLVIDLLSLHNISLQFYVVNFPSQQRTINPMGEKKTEKQIKPRKSKKK